MTSSLVRREWQQKEKVADGFTSQYNVSLLVYYEMYDSVEEAIKREKQLKVWRRKWKNDLIEKIILNWRICIQRSLDRLDPESSSG